MAIITNPNDVLDRLKIVLDAALVPTFLQGGYDYRTMPSKFVKYYIITFMGQLPMPLTSGSDNLIGHQNIGMVVLLKHDKTEAGIRTAERDLNDIEHATIQALHASRNQAEYHKIVFPYTSGRPRAPVESPEYRIAEIPFRVVLK
jgi:hypothetical protein